MERSLANINNELDPSFNLDPQSIRLMDFQGERSRVFIGKSPNYGLVVIKTALEQNGISQTGIDEIKMNLSGYKHIPTEFRPDILSVNEDNSVMILKHAGLPIRDLLWINRDNLGICETIILNFQKNLTTLYDLTKNTSAGKECKTYLKDLVSKGNSFLSSGFFPEELRRGFNRIAKMALGKSENVGSFANMDSTQGNLLIDTATSPQTLKLIDPKSPRTTNGVENFTGISVIDLGMFLTTVELNSPAIFQRLAFENTLLSVGRTIYSDPGKAQLYLDLGKAFGCILIATFPNSVDRVKTYLESFGVELSGNKLIEVVNERQRHIDKAVKIVHNY